MIHIYLHSDAPVAQLDRATDFNIIGAFVGKRNRQSGQHCIGEPLTDHADGNTEETGSYYHVY